MVELFDNIERGIENFLKRGEQIGGAHLEIMDKLMAEPEPKESDLTVFSKILDEAIRFYQDWYQTFQESWVAISDYLKEHPLETLSDADRATSDRVVEDLYTVMDFIEEQLSTILEVRNEVANVYGV